MHYLESESSFIKPPVCVRLDPPLGSHHAERQEIVVPKLSSNKVGLVYYGAFGLWNDRCKMGFCHPKDSLFSFHRIQLGPP